MTSTEIELPVVGGGGSSGVSSFNTLTGAVTISAGANITLTPSGNNIAISGGTGGGPGSPSTAIQYNNAGSFGGGSLITPDTGTSFYTPEWGFGVLENQLSQAAEMASPWISGYGTSTYGQTDPNGTTTAVKYQFQGRTCDGFYQGYSYSAGTYTMSMWMKGNSGGEVVYLGFTAGGPSFAIDSQVAVTLTTSWARYSVSVTPTAAADSVGVWVQGTGVTAFLWGAQKQTQAFAGPFLPTGTGVFGGPSGSKFLAASLACINTLQLNNPINNFRLEALSGLQSGSPHRIYYDTSGNQLVYQNNGGTAVVVATLGGGNHTISALGTVNMSSGTGSISDAAITTSSIVQVQVISANNPGVYQVSVGTGSASIQSYNPGFGMNNSDTSTLSYFVVN